MFRFFCCKSKSTEDYNASKPLLEAEAIGNTNEVNTHAQEDQSRCGLSKFWISWEFISNFVKVGCFSTFAIAVPLTDAAKFESDYDSARLSNKAVLISLPFAILFATAEGLCHYAESKLISNIDTDIEKGNVNTSPSLTKSQLFLVCLHLASDVFADVGGYIAVASLLGLDKYTALERVGIYAGLTLWNIGGNVQEALNASKSFSESNRPHKH